MNGQVPADSTMLFRKRDEYPSDGVNVFAEPVITFIYATHFSKCSTFFINVTPLQILILVFVRWRRLPISTLRSITRMLASVTRSTACGSPAIRASAS